MTQQVYSISAVTLETRDMSRAVEFYGSLGLARHRGGPHSDFTTFVVGDQHLNLRQTASGNAVDEGCLVILGVESADSVYARLVEMGCQPEFAPRDASWGERYFHVRDPDGHHLSFAQRLHSGNPADRGCGID